MIKETNNKTNLYNIVLNGIKSDLNHEEKVLNSKFRGYLRKCSQSVYALIDSESQTSIKCVFDKQSLEDYLQTEPSYLDFDSFNNCAISVKKYKFDYLIFAGGASGTQGKVTYELDSFLDSKLSYFVVLYIQDFEIDRSVKKLSAEEDFSFRNINEQSEISRTVAVICSERLQKVHNEPSTEEFTVPLNATNFIKRDFPEDCSPKLLSLFNTFRRRKNLESDNFLVKCEYSLPNGYDYLLDQSDFSTIERVRQFDFKSVFSRNPTQIEKKQGEEFSISKSNMPKETKEKAIKEALTTPSPLVLDVEDSPENIQKFLLRKIKRSTTKLDANVVYPEPIKQLIRDYSDVCVNLTSDCVKKYLYYQRFYSFTMGDR